jgi:hypothetical protein
MTFRGTEVSREQYGRALWQADDCEAGERVMDVVEHG